MIMEDAQVDLVVQRATEGIGIESALRELGVDSNTGTAFLKAHLDARQRILDAKHQFRQTRLLVTAPASGADEAAVKMTSI